MLAKKIEPALVVDPAFFLKETLHSGIPGGGYVEIPISGIEIAKHIRDMRSPNDDVKMYAAEYLLDMHDQLLDQEGIEADALKDRIEATLTGAGFPVPKQRDFHPKIPGQHPEP